MLIQRKTRWAGTHLPKQYIVDYALLALVIMWCLVLVFPVSPVRADLMEGMSPPPDSWDMQLRYFYLDSKDFCGPDGHPMSFPGGSFDGHTDFLMIQPIYYGKDWAYHVIIPVMDTRLGGFNVEDSGIGDITVGVARIHRNRKLNWLLALDVKLKNGSYDPANPASLGTNQIDIFPGYYVTRFHQEGRFHNSFTVLPFFRKENKATGLKPGDELRWRYTYGVKERRRENWWGLNIEGITGKQWEQNGVALPGSGVQIFSAGIQYLVIHPPAEAIMYKLSLPVSARNAPETFEFQIKYDHLFAW